MGFALGAESDCSFYVYDLALENHTKPHYCQQLNSAMKLIFSLQRGFSHIILQFYVGACLAKNIIIIKVFMSLLLMKDPILWYS